MFKKILVIGALIQILTSIVESRPTLTENKFEWFDQNYLSVSSEPLDLDTSVSLYKYVFTNGNGKKTYVASSKKLDQTELKEVVRNYERQARSELEKFNYNFDQDISNIHKLAAKMKNSFSFSNIHNPFSAFSSFPYFNLPFFNDF